MSQPPQKKVFLTNQTPKWGNDYSFHWKQDPKQMISAIHLVLRGEAANSLHDPDTFLHRAQLCSNCLVISNISAAVLAAIPELRITKSETEYRLRLPFGFDRVYFPESQPLRDMLPDASLIIQLVENTTHAPKLEAAWLEIEMETAAPRNSYKQFESMQFKYSGKGGHFWVGERKNLEAIMVRVREHHNQAVVVKLTKAGESQDHVFTLSHINQWVRFEAVNGVPVDAEELIIHVTHAENATDCTLDIVYETRVIE